MKEDNQQQEQDLELTLESLYDVPVQISVVLGNTTMQLSNLLKLTKGAVVELERNVGDPVDVYVNNKLVAKGELVVIDSKIGVTLTSIVVKENVIPTKDTN